MFYVRHLLEYFVCIGDEKRWFMDNDKKNKSSSAIASSSIRVALRIPRGPLTRALFLLFRGLFTSFCLIICYCFVGQRGVPVRIMLAIYTERGRRANM